MRYADRVCVVVSNDSLSPVISELVDELIRRKKQFCLVVNNKGYYLDELSKLKDYLKSKGEIFRGGSGFLEPIREKLEKAGAPIIYVWPEAVNSLRYMMKSKPGFITSMGILLNYRRIVRYSGIKELEQYMRRFDEALVDRRAALFDDITNLLLNDIDDFITKENEELQALDARIAEIQKTKELVEKDIDKRIDEYFEKAYYNRYSKEDIYDRFGELSTNKASVEFKEFVDEMISAPEFTEGVVEIAKQLPIFDNMTRMNPVLSNVGMIKGRKLLYGYEVIKGLKYVGHGLCVGGGVISFTGVGASVGGVLAGVGGLFGLTELIPFIKDKNKVKEERTEEVYKSVTQAMLSAIAELKRDYGVAIEKEVKQRTDEIHEFQTKKKDLMREFKTMPNLVGRLKGDRCINVQKQNSGYRG